MFVNDRLFFEIFVELFFFFTQNIEELKSNFFHLRSSFVSDRIAKVCVLNFLLTVRSSRGSNPRPWV